MKKTFQLKVEGKNDDRVVESVKNQYRKYVKRERKKALPTGADYWHFECSFAQPGETPEQVHLNEIGTRIDTAVAAACTECYIEIHAVPVVRRVQDDEDEIEGEAELDSDLPTEQE